MLLRTIDTLWVDHLTELDDFRRGVGLRGYGGTDPLVEFKREAFKLYEELRGFIRHQVATTIFRVNVQRRRRRPSRPRCPCPPRSSSPLSAPAARRRRTATARRRCRWRRAPCVGRERTPVRSSRSGRLDRDRRDQRHRRRAAPPR